jgi:hypothetical protein
MRDALMIHGTTTPRFAAVRDAFAASFERFGDVGAACAIYHRGEPVVEAVYGSVS